MLFQVQADENSASVWISDPSESFSWPTPSRCDVKPKSVVADFSIIVMSVVKGRPECACWNMRNIARQDNLATPTVYRQHSAGVDTLLSSVYQSSARTVQ